MRSTRRTAVRHRLTGRGFWYFIIPVISLGVLSALPFWDAWLRTRDRRAGWLAVLYGVGGSVWIILSIVLDEGDSARALFGLYVWFLPVAACVQVAGFRRVVFDTVNEPATGGSVGDGVRPADEHGLWALLGELLGVLAILAFALMLAVVVPVEYVLRTLSTNDSDWFETTNAVALTLGMVVGIPFFLYFLIRQVDPTGNVLTLVYAVGGAVVINVYLGGIIWIAGTEWINVDFASSNPRQFGMLVWWNLVDSIPLIDVDSALNWEKPVDDYGASIGWLLLLQRVVLLLTLARAIQMLAARLLTRSAPPPASPGSRTPRPPGSSLPPTRLWTPGSRPT